MTKEVIIMLCLIALLCVAGCLDIPHLESGPPVFRTVTVADKYPVIGGMGGGAEILGTDGNIYTINDFSILVKQENDLREAKGLMPLYSQFYWNKAFLPNDTYTCEFGTAISGNLLLHDCIKVSGEP